MWRHVTHHEHRVIHHSGHALMAGQTFELGWKDLLMFPGFRKEICLLWRMGELACIRCLSILRRLENGSQNGEGHSHPRYTVVNKTTIRGCRSAAVTKPSAQARQKRADSCQPHQRAQRSSVIDHGLETPQRKVNRSRACPTNGGEDEDGMTDDGLILNERCRRD